jgi:DNA topoisomerase VI subunit B
MQLPVEPQEIKPHRMASKHGQLVTMLKASSAGTMAQFS